MKANVQWNLPTQRTDNSALPAAQIAQIKVFSSLNGGGYGLIGTAAGDATSFLTDVLAPGTYNFKVTAVDTDDQESALSPGSNAVTVVALPAPPNPPSNVGATLVA